MGTARDRTEASPSYWILPSPLVSTSFVIFLSRSSAFFKAAEERKRCQ